MWSILLFSCVVLCFLVMLVCVLCLVRLMLSVSLGFLLHIMTFTWILRVRGDKEQHFRQEMIYSFQIMSFPTSSVCLWSIYLLVIRYSRACDSYHDVIDRVSVAANKKLLNHPLFRHSWRITCFITRRVPHVEQELLTLPQHLSSPQVF